MTRYVHGYSDRERERLQDQAAAVRELLHRDTGYAAGELVLEPGCGVGAQTVTLARTSPGAQIVSVDIQCSSARQAREAVRAEGAPERQADVAFGAANVFGLPFDDARFDHVFVCYVLEHLVGPSRALAEFRRVLRPGGTITVIEGDHGSCYWHPESDAARRAWQALIDAQAALGGDSLIGRRLYPLLAEAGFSDVKISPRMVYCDGSLPGLQDAFVGRTISPMVETARERAIGAGLIDEETFERGVRELYALATTPESTFSYTFFKAVGVR